MGFLGEQKQPGAGDPFKLNANTNREKLDKQLLEEINNGRLAMLGIMGFLGEQKQPGAVPFLEDLVKPYAGQPMAPFSDVDTQLGFVRQMLPPKIPEGMVFP